MCFCVFAVLLELLRMQEMRCQKMVYQSCKCFRVGKKAYEGHRQTRLCFVCKECVWRTGKILQQKELTGSEHHHRTVQQVRDDVCWIMVF